MSTDTKLRSYIDRILRSREREDAEKANTKEIYKELAGDGYDKTTVGKVVNHLRKDGDKAREESEKFDLYLTAYLGASHVHAREAKRSAALDALAAMDADIIDADTGEVLNDIPMSNASGQPGGDDPVTTDDAASAGETANHSEAADLVTVTVAETDLVPRGAAASEPIADISKPNPICRDPDDCGVYASWHLTCEKCKAAAALRSAA